MSSQCQPVEEIIRWIFTDDELPDEEIIVLLFAPDLGSENVWLGWLDEGEWLVDNATKLDCEVIAWADMPSGPKKREESDE